MEIVKQVIKEVLETNGLWTMKFEKCHQVSVNTRIGCVASNLLLIDAKTNSIPEELTSQIIELLAASTDRNVSV